MLENLDLCESVNDNKYRVRNVNFEETINGTLYLDYPLSVVIKEQIKFKSLHELIKEIRKVYKEIYKKPNEYGVWGHSIFDLVIESIIIYEDNLIEVNIGS